jgi:scyllo-inositol 2-dehydrogenase (NADP+)
MTIDELLNDAEIELIIVNTPNNLHLEHAIKAMRAGKHVLVEKPAAATVEQVKELFEVGRET